MNFSADIAIALMSACVFVIAFKLFTHGPCLCSLLDRLNEDTRMDTATEEFREAYGASSSAQPVKALLTI